MSEYNWADIEADVDEERGVDSIGPEVDAGGGETLGVSTQYARLEYLGVGVHDKSGVRFLIVEGDSGHTNTQVRVPFPVLEQLGWTPPKTAEKLAFEAFKAEMLRIEAADPNAWRCAGLVEATDGLEKYYEEHDTPQEAWQTLYDDNAAYFE
jgi:hypothetical protein